jgi:hypothetical protein
MMFDSGEWGNWFTQQAASTLFYGGLDPDSMVVLKTGSSRHHQRIRPGMEATGFTEHTAARYIMAKAVG